MRDPKRIPKVLKLIKKIWEDNPDLRLCQLLLNADITYWTEDDILENTLKSVYEVKG